MEQATVRAITHDTSEAKVTVSGVPDKPGIAARLFRVLADGGVNVDMIVQNVSDRGVADISFTVPLEDADRAVSLAEQLQEELGAVAVAADREIARVSVIGAGMKTNPGIAATMFETLADADINLEMISTSAIRISCVVQQSQVEEAVALLHSVYELGN